MTAPPATSVLLSREDTWFAAWRGLLWYALLMPPAVIAQFWIPPMLASSSTSAGFSFAGLLQLSGFLLLQWAIAAIIGAVVGVIPMSLGALIAIGLREPLSHSRRAVVHALTAGGIAMVLAAATIVAVELVYGGPVPLKIPPSDAATPILHLLAFAVPAFIGGVLGWYRTHQLAKRPQRPVSWGAIPSPETSA